MRGILVAFEPSDNIWVTDTAQKRRFMPRLRCVGQHTRPPQQSVTRGAPSFNGAPPFLLRGQELRVANLGGLVGRTIREQMHLHHHVLVNDVRSSVQRPKDDNGQPASSLTGRHRAEVLRGDRVHTVGAGTFGRSRAAGATGFDATRCCQLNRAAWFQAPGNAAGRTAAPGRRPLASYPAGPAAAKGAATAAATAVVTAAAENLPGCHQGAHRASSSPSPGFPHAAVAPVARWCRLCPAPSCVTTSRDSVRVPLRLAIGHKGRPRGSYTASLTANNIC